MLLAPYVYAVAARLLCSFCRSLNSVAVVNLILAGTLCRSKRFMQWLRTSERNAATSVTPLRGRTVAATI